MISTAKKIQNESNVKALKRIRKLKGMSRKELATLLGVTVKAIEKYENGRDILSEERISKILAVMQMTQERFKKVKRGKGIKTKAEREIKVVQNSDRRSYQRIITKECRVLRSMRRTMRITQDDASALCGYPRATIGHIENGRIELSKKRIKYIIECYGFKYSDFESNLGKEAQRDEIVDSCINKIQLLDDTKLEIVKNLLGSL